jgi:hypothetical protein
MHNYMSPFLQGIGNMAWEQRPMKYALKKEQPIYMSKAEFAKKAGVPLSAVGRLEKGKTYLLDTKGKKIVDIGYDFPIRRLISVPE